MDARQERGLVIAATSKIEKNRLGWKLPSQSDKLLLQMWQRIALRSGFHTV